MIKIDLSPPTSELRFSPVLARPNTPSPSLNRSPVRENAVTSSVRTKSEDLVTRDNEQKSFYERLFDASVDLKVGFANYAMYVSESERNRTFAELDYVLDPSSWDPDDTLPTRASFVNFLKWKIYSGIEAWSSLGVGHNGEILVAWVTDKLQMTAHFSPDGRVIWTTRVVGESGPNLSNGVSDLKHFAEVAHFYLEK